jgi:5'-methylthioadenosine phosphorylase
VVAAGRVGRIGWVGIRPGERGVVAAGRVGRIGWVGIRPGECGVVAAGRVGRIRCQTCPVTQTDQTDQTEQTGQTELAEQAPGGVPDIAIIGGSGFYEFLGSPTTVEVSTPYGNPSAPISVGEVAGRPVAFVPRHGRRHEFPPHRVNYRANLWALRSLGVRRVLAPCAVGSLQPEHGPGELVVPDQLVDRTSGRPQTFYDEGAVHVPFADPYCPALRTSLIDARDGIVDGGTMVVVEGPRFSTRAEARWFASLGWSVVNMTGHPEAVLARELALCYATIALVTDRDAGLSEGEHVDQATVFAEFAKHLDQLRAILMDVVAGLPAGREGCDCASALEGIVVPVALP